MFDARRSKVRGRLIDDGIAPDEADGWLAAWLHAARILGRRASEQGYGWIADQLTNRQKP
jgi:hypothetical protein